VLYFFRGKIAPILAPVVGRFLPSWNENLITFYGHFLTLVAAAVYMLPLEFVGFSGAKRAAFMFSIWSSVLTSMYGIKANYGTPPVPQNLSWSNWKEVMATTLQPWLQKVMPTPNFQFLFFALIFLTAYPSIWVLAIIGRRALAACSKAEKSQSKLWSLFKFVWVKASAKENEAQVYAAFGEVVLGIWLTISLVLPTRQVLVCILYWNFLRTRFQVPGKSKELHTKAWQTLHQQAQPVLKFIPFSQKGIDMAKKWFQPQYG